MIIIPLPTAQAAYTSNAYWILGNAHRPQDRNSLVDTGSADVWTQGEGYSTLASHPKGIGKRAVEQIVLTHSHFDHIGGLPLLNREFHPQVYAFQPGPGIHHVLKDGQILHLGDREAVVLHTPGHSPDSICLYIPSEKVLFSGDTPVAVHVPGGCYSKQFLESLERLVGLAIDTIYPGHGAPITRGARQSLKRTLEAVRHSTIE